MAAVRADHAHYYDLMHTMDGHVADRVVDLEADGVLDDTIKSILMGHYGIPAGDAFEMLRRQSQDTSNNTNTWSLRPSSASMPG